jgi:hypothetical protein
MNITVWLPSAATTPERAWISDLLSPLFPALTLQGQPTSSESSLALYQRLYAKPMQLLCTSGCHLQQPVHMYLVRQNAQNAAVNVQHA